MSRTLSGINEENSIDIPSTPNSIRIGGKLGQRGFLVGVNNTTGNIDFVQAETPFIPPDTILGEDLNSNIGFETTASENGGVIRIHNATNTATLNADKIITSDLDLTSDLDISNLQVKTLLKIQPSTDNTRKAEIVASNGDIIQYESYTDATTNNEYASIKSGVGAFRSITLAGTITGATNITGSGLIKSTDKIEATNEVKGGSLVSTGTLSVGTTTTLTGNVECGGNLTLTNPSGELTIEKIFKGIRTIGGVDKTFFQLSIDDEDIEYEFYKRNLVSGNMDKTISLTSSDGGINCDNLVVDEDATIGGNLGITGNLTIGGNLNYDGELSFTNLIFDGFLSQRLDDNDATTELLKATIDDNSSGQNGGSTLILKTKSPPGINTISDSITLDGKSGNITNVGNITTTGDISCDTLTATNFTFDNNLTAKKITADTIEIVDNANDNEKAIELDGLTGNITLNYDDNSGGILSAKSVVSSGDISGAGITASAQLSGNSLSITTSGVVSGAFTCGSLTSGTTTFTNLGAGKITCDEIEIQDKANANEKAIELDGTTGNITLNYADNTGGILSAKQIVSSGSISGAGISSSTTITATGLGTFGSLTAGNTTITGTLTYNGDLNIDDLTLKSLLVKDNTDTTKISLEGDNGIFDMTGTFTNNERGNNTTILERNIMLGGLKIGVSGENTERLTCECESNFNDRMICSGGITFLGEPSADSVNFGAIPFFCNSDTNPSTIRRLQITSSGGKLEFMNATAELVGYTQSNPTPCKNLDLTDSSIKFPPAQLVDANTYFRGVDATNNARANFNGGMSDFLNLLGYDNNGDRITLGDLTFTASGNSTQVRMYFEVIWNGDFIDGAIFMGLMEINQDTPQTTEGMVFQTTRVLYNETTNIHDGQHRYYCYGIFNRDQQYRVAPYIFSTSSLTSVVAYTRIGDSEGITDPTDPSTIAYPSYSIKAVPTSLYNTSFFVGNINMN